MVAFGGLTLVADTGINGFALQDATPAIVSWTAPDDGEMHTVLFAELKHVTTLEAGGAVEYTFTSPDGSSVSAALDSGTRSPGLFASASNMRFIKPGSTVTISQSSALTSGATLVFAQIWAS